jgi:hypothetical protein
MLGLISFATAVGQAKPDPKVSATSVTKATEQLPTVDQVLDKYVQALGGKAAVERLTSTSMKGTLDVPSFNLSGTAEAYAKAPGKYVSIIDVAQYGVVAHGYDGKAGWSNEPQAGLRDLAGGELAQLNRQGDLHKSIKLKELYPKMAVKEKGKVGDREAYIIEATPSEGGMEKLYFDTQTGLLVRQDVDSETPQGKQAIEIYSDDYKEVDGVKLPFGVHEVTPEYSFTIKWTEIKTNVAVDDAKFSKPGAK